ncbi:class I SAM-dependent methyltransferase [Albimonas pacifica]|uniref:class I SAM-dependent methyltransferase n=1 Tax=Albimonas pacifica TaxID=1114924 RepID=UPI0011602D45|nr:methyltransferase domain-containing protein [Albimonas pacifica]
MAADLARLNYRHELLIAANASLLKDARVLDLACNDGRFGLAALEGAGAAHVLGVEARDEAIARGRRAFADYGIDPARYEFRQGDVFEALARMTPGAFDTALVLGFLYHTPRQYELFAHLDRLGVRNVIVDSQVIRAGGRGARARRRRMNEGEPRVFVEMRWEGAAKDGAIADPRGRGEALSTIPSAGALEMWLQEFGWTVARTPLPPPAPNTGVYRRGLRVAMTGTR